MVCNVVINIVYLNLNFIFNIFECSTYEISIFGQEKHYIVEIEPGDFLTIFLRFWLFEPHFLINFFLIKNVYTQFLSN